MRVSLELTICGQTFHLGTHPEEPDEVQGDVVIGTPSSVEFGFTPEPPDYWTPQVPNRS